MELHSVLIPSSWALATAERTGSSQLHTGIVACHCPPHHWHHYQLLPPHGNTPENELDSSCMDGGMEEENEEDTS